jgi:transposase, IS30 family
MAALRVPVDVQDRFWRLRLEGLSASGAAAAVGVSQSTGSKGVVEAGGMMPRRVRSQRSGRYLSLAERIEIAMLRSEGLSIRQIAARLGRSPSTVSRELSRNGDCSGRYRPLLAENKAAVRARRPKRRRLHCPGRLRNVVQAMLRRKMSPEQISKRLVLLFPDDEAMSASPETIYQAIYVQAKGQLKVEVTQCLRTGRAIRRPRRKGQERRGRIPNKVMISERPAEVEDRAVPGHWEGDLIIGKNNASAIGTLVERSTRYLMLLHLPDGQGADTVQEQMIAAISRMPDQLRKTLTWDQGPELAKHQQITMATDMAIYFCDPHSPWQRGTNENTNGLLRQYFPKGTDLSVHTPADLTKVEHEMNTRPRKTLDFYTPAEKLEQLLFDLPKPRVATNA